MLASVPLVAEIAVVSPVIRSEYVGGRRLMRRRPQRRLALTLLGTFLALSWSCASSSPFETDGGDVDADTDADSDVDTHCDSRDDSDSGVDAEFDANFEGDDDCTPGCGGGPCEPGEWATICAGTFVMGSPSSEEGRGRDENQHEVRLTGDVALQSTEVTVAQFEEVMGYTRSWTSRCAHCPAVNMSWHEAAAYCNVLSEIAGLDRCYECTGRRESVVCEPSGTYSSPYDCPGYRLPTEAEWEFSARSGISEARYGGLDDVAWFYGNSGSETHDVGTRAASPWGLYDMLGNVAEWCHDVYDVYPSGCVTDPSGVVAGYANRVVRGGSFLTNAERVRATARDRSGSAYSYPEVGLRPLKSLH